MSTLGKQSDVLGFRARMNRDTSTWLYGVTHWIGEMGVFVGLMFLVDRRWLC
jgi:hypothetical protein